jgi:hypothetical protein
MLRRVILIPGNGGGSNFMNTASNAIININPFYGLSIDFYVKINLMIFL